MKMFTLPSAPILGVATPADQRGQNYLSCTNSGWSESFRGVSETGPAKTGSAIDVRIDDAGSILKFRIGFSL